jgi:hypothetical protein
MMLPDLLRDAVNNDIEELVKLSLIDLGKLPLDTSQDETTAMVAAHVAALFRFVATVTRSVDRAEAVEREFLARVRLLDADGSTAH